MRHAYADVNGVRLHYVTVGRGPLVMFVHGFPEFWYEWKHQLREFGRDHQAVAPDMRGYNLSSKPADVDQVRGCRQPQLHHGDQALPARQDLGLVAVLGEELQRLLERVRSVVLEPRRQHREPPRSEPVARKVHAPQRPVM